jgi:hypothetical protein
LYGCEIWTLTLIKTHRLQTYESKELLKIFGPMKDEVNVQFRKLNNEELHDIYRSHNFVMIVKCRLLQWAVTGIRSVRRIYKILVGKPLEKVHLEDKEEYWRIILKWILGRYVLRMRGKRKWLRIVFNDALWC